MQKADTKIGHYYVSAIDGSKYYLMSGPYESHQSALDHVDRVRYIAEENDRRAVWMSFGTCRKEGETRPGRLQLCGLFRL